MRVGVFGGSFDPVHVGHLGVARAAARVLNLAEVLLVPARAQPFKTGGHHASPEHRLAMLRLAVRGDATLVVDERELHRPGPSYAVDTLDALRAARPADRLFLLVGADAAWDLPAWHGADRLVTLATVVALTRPGVTVPTHPFIGHTLSVPAIAVSATDVRARCARGEPIESLVPRAVARYIASHGLYREGV